MRERARAPCSRKSARGRNGDYPSACSPPPLPPARDERQRRNRDSPISHFATGFPPRWRSRHVPPCSLAAARTRVLFAYFAASPKGWSRARRWRGGSGFRERPRGVTYGPKDCHLAGNFGLLRERGITGAANTASRLLPHLATVAYPLARDAHLPEYLPPSSPPPCPPPGDGGGEALGRVSRPNFPHLWRDVAHDRMACAAPNYPSLLRLARVYCDTLSPRVMPRCPCV